MYISSKELIDIALLNGATKSGVISTENLKFDSYLRKLCKDNSCGNYAKTWMCPPGIGKLEDLKEKVKRYNKCLIVQTIFPLTDSFDYEGMVEGKKKLKETMKNIYKNIKENVNNEDVLSFGVGKCDICSECTYPKGEPCIYPNEAMSSLEAYGINVKEAVEKCGFLYVNGQNTVSYVGAILFNE